MDIEEFDAFFEKELSQNNIETDKKYYNYFYNYMKQIIDWNDKINVTAITDEKMFIVKHFIDSLTISKYINEKDKVIDVGTGAGFPGIPLKFSKPQLSITLIDSVNKKLNVIRDITQNMNLEKLEILHSRAEDLANDKNYREKYDVVTTRAVSNLSTIAEYMLPLLKINGIAICMKGPNINEELEESRKAIEILGGKIEKIEKTIIDNEIERNIIIIKKVKSTPKNFPRKNGKPLKEPIR